MKIVFMGTPEFAVPSLAALHKAGHEIVGVYTQPDRARGRGMRQCCSPVKECAMALGLPVFQPDTFRDRVEEAHLRELAPDLIVVVAYGKLLPGYVLRAAPMGAVNVHASLLPKYRGAGPIQWAVIRGERETGVTTMHMARALDAGDMILKKSMPIGERDTAQDVHDRLKLLGAEVLIETVGQMLAGTAPRTAQDEALVTWAPVLTKQDACIDWTKSASEVCDLVRGTFPWPGAYTVADDEMIKVFSVTQGGYTTQEVPGTVVACSAAGVHVACGDGQVAVIHELQAQGRRRMCVMDYLCGNELPVRLGCAVAQSMH